MWQQFWGRFSGRDEVEHVGNGRRYPNPLQWYRQTFALLPRLRTPIMAALVALVGGVVLGIVLGHVYELPPDIQGELTGTKMVENLADLQLFVGALPYLVLFQNIRVVLLMALVGVFTFGVLTTIIFILPWGLIGYIATQFALAGQNPYAFLLAAIIPHALVELPALLIAAAAALRWHTTSISPPPDRTLSESFLSAAANFIRLLVGLVIPLLAIAAFIEAYVTPQVMVWVYGG